MNRASSERRVELLSPGGSMESIRAAVNAGADAVYAGGRLFGARAFADNPETLDLLEAIDYCHLRGAKLYLTVNTLLKEHELTDMLPEFLAPIYEHGVDAVLVQDFGVFHFLKRTFPDLPLHASTQMTVTGPDGVRLLQNMGAGRVVLSRELSLEEIHSIRSQCDVELETFVHGALCYCYSGKCLMSSLIGGRSGNRGRCAQPCRLPWDLYESRADMKAKKSLNDRSQQYLLSPKDICTLRLLPDLIDAGIASLKIEGRMKSAEYAAGVTAMYRKYIDRYLEGGREGYREEEADEKLLLELFSRGGFSEGYYQEKNGPDMMTLEEKTSLKGDSLRHAQESVDLIRRQYVDAPKKVALQANVVIHAGQQARMHVADTAGHSYTARGFVPSPAINRPADSSTVLKQAGKSGNTDFSFESIDIDLDDGLFVQVRDLNELRRSALDGIRREILAAYRRNPVQEACTAAPGNCASAAHARPCPEQSGDLSGNSPALPPTVSHDRAESESLRIGTPVRGLYMDGYKSIAHPAVTASVSTRGQLEAVLQSSKVGGVYLDLSLCTAKNIELVWISEKKAYLMLPGIWRESTQRIVRDRMEREFGAWSPAMKSSLDGIVAGCYDQLQALEDAHLLNDGDGFEVIADASVYTWNKDARECLRELGVTMDTLPYELSLQEAQARGCEGSECVVYGYQPLMLSAQCLVKTASRCTKESADGDARVRYLKDRKGILFPVKNDCMLCLGTIFNSVPLDLVTLSAQVKQLGVSSVRYHFTVESEEETRRILKGKLPDKVTRGHFRKGVD